MVVREFLKTSGVDFTKYTNNITKLRRRYQRLLDTVNFDKNLNKNIVNDDEIIGIYNIVIYTVCRLL